MKELSKSVLQYKLALNLELNGHVVIDPIAKKYIYYFHDFVPASEMPNVSDFIKKEKSK